MNTNSKANSRPAAMPASRVPSRLNSGMPRKRAQASSSTVATIERIAACIDERHVGGDPLDRHLLESPQRGEQQHHRNRGGVERSAFLTHRADFGVTWVHAARRKSRPFDRTVSTPKEEVRCRPGRVLERPDGFYWESKETKELRGPFATRAEAEADLLAGGDADGEFEPEARRCRKPNPSSASPSGSTPTPAARRRTTSRASKTTEHGCNRRDGCVSVVVPGRVACPRVPRWR